MTERRALRAAAGLAVVAGWVAGGCSSSGGNPFGSSSDFDRTFIAAAQTWDLNKDGTVTCNEWIEYISQGHREADGNGDGAVDAEEWPKLVKSDRLFEMANLKYYDANGDGRVTREEMVGTHNVAFKLLDKNQDCQIDRTEIVQVHGVDKVKPKEQDQSLPRAGGSRGGY